MHLITQNEQHLVNVLFTRSSHDDVLEQTFFFSFFFESSITQFMFCPHSVLMVIIIVANKLQKAFDL